MFMETMITSNKKICLFHQEAQVFTLFAGLKDNKASLNVPNKLIKLASGPLSMPFTRIYNESILSGQVPAVCF